MFKHIIARTPARSLVDGLTSSHLGKPDYAKALEQHNAYIRALQTCDVDITLLPPDERFPDSVFVEDPVLCTSRCAIITRPAPNRGAARPRSSRKPCSASIRARSSASRHPARWKPATS
ncbi:N-Dimethylarginine dimethylaminohydrolase [Pseudomonas aeruginosa]|nr:N-Dimethylarginine dimethylaminohydrolase [Pseudomonas aeruginosa]